MKIAKKKSGIYLLDRRSEGLGTTSLGTRDYGEAQLRASDILAGRDRKRQDFFTVSQALDLCWDRYWRGSKNQDNMTYTIEVIRRAWGSHPVASVTYREVAKWVSELRSGHKPMAPATINKYLSCLSKGLVEAANEGHLENPPRMPRQKVRNTKLRFISDAEEVLLLNQCAKLNAQPARPQGGGAPAYPRTGYVMSDLIVALLHTGCRLSELLLVSPGDLGSDSLHLADTKNGASRVVPLNLPARHSLQRLFAEPTWKQVTHDLRDSHGNIVQARMRAARSWCVRRFTRVRDLAGLKDVSLHTLRHTTASRLVQAGVPLYTVGQILGHSSPAVTQRYAHLTVDHLRPAMELLGTPKEYGKSPIGEALEACRELDGMCKHLGIPAGSEGSKSD